MLLLSLSQATGSPSKTPSLTPTAVPTRNPTVSPTASPTFHPCNQSNTHNCDQTAGGVCVDDTNAPGGWSCMCAVGYTCIRGCEIGTPEPFAVYLPVLQGCVAGPLNAPASSNQ